MTRWGRRWQRLGLGVGGDDSLQGVGGNDSLFGDDGNDTLAGGLGADSLNGGFGNDLIGGDDDNDSVRAGAGDDSVTGGEGDDSLIGGAGNDTLDGGMGNDTLDGSDGFDWANYAAATAGVAVSLALGGPQNTLGAGTDAVHRIEGLVGSAYADTLIGDANDNVLDGGGGNNSLVGGSGDDTLLQGYGNASGTLNGEDGNDSLAASLGKDSLVGGDGNDTLFASQGDDTLDGGAGNDSLDGGGNTDLASYASASAAVNVSLAIAGPQHTLGAGIDTLAHIEQLAGSAFDDTLTGFANGSYDRLIGGAGADLLNAGSGDDKFVYTAITDSGLGGSHDTIVGFGGIGVNGETRSTSRRSTPIWEWRAIRRSASLAPKRLPALPANCTRWPPTAAPTA